MAEPDRPQMTT